MTDERFEEIKAHMDHQKSLGIFRGKEAEYLDELIQEREQPKQQEPECEQPMRVGPCQMCGDYGADCRCGQGEPTGTDDDLIAEPVVDAMREHLKQQQPIPGLPEGFRIARLEKVAGYAEYIAELEPIAPQGEPK